MSRLDELAQKRALLVARADLERVQIALAWQEIRNRVFPAPEGKGRPRWQTWTLRALRVVLPMLGVIRMRRVVGALAAGAAIYKALRAFKGRRAGER